MVGASSNCINVLPDAMSGPPGSPEQALYPHEEDELHPG